MRADFGRCTARSECVLVQEYNGGTSAGGVCSPPWRRLRCRHPPARTTPTSHSGDPSVPARASSTPPAASTPTPMTTSTWPTSGTNGPEVRVGRGALQRLGQLHRQRHARPPHRRGGGQPRQRVRGGRRARPRGEARLDRRLRQPARLRGRHPIDCAAGTGNGQFQSPLASRTPSTTCMSPTRATTGCRSSAVGTFQWAFGGSAAGPRRSIPRALTSAAAARSMSPTRATTAWSAGT